MRQQPEPRPVEERLGAPDWIEAEGGVALTADLECGNATGIEATGPARFSVAPLEDDLPRDLQRTGPISAYSICVAAENRGLTAVDLELEVRVPSWLIQDGFDYFLRKPYLTASFEGGRMRPALDWEQIPEREQWSWPDTVLVRVPLEGRSRRVISTTARYPYSTCCERLAELAASHPAAKLVWIDKSVLGRKIVGLEAGNPEGPCVVFTGTLQPGEPSAWAVLSMIEAALDEQADWLEHYRLCFLPQPNPDGIVLGLCNVNGLHELAMLGFAEAAGGLPAPREARVLWDYLAELRPVVFIDYHFLALPDHDLPKTYFIDPAIYEDPARSAAAIELNERLLALSGAERPRHVTIDDEMWRQHAIHQAAEHLDAISFIYQYTGPTTSHTEAQIRGAEVMRAALEVCAGL